MEDNFCGSPFWGHTVLPISNASNTTGEALNSTEVPDFTQCFQNTALVWIPCGYLFIVAPFYIYYLLTVKYRGRTTWLNLSKTLISALLVAICVLDLIYRLRERISGRNPWPAQTLAGFIQVIAMIISLGLIQLGRLRAVRSTGVLFIYWLLQLVASLLILQSRARVVHHQVDSTTVFLLTYIGVFSLLVLIQLILASLVDTCDLVEEVELDKKVCPEGKASFLSVITFWWFTRMVILGFRRPLTRDDLWSLNTEDTSREVYPLFEKEWRKEMNKCLRAHEASKSKAMEISRSDASGTVQLTSLTVINDDFKEEDKPLKGNEEEKRDTVKGVCSKPCVLKDSELDAECKKNTYNPKLWLALTRTFGLPFLVGSFFKLGHDILLFVSPLLLKLLIHFIYDRSLPVWHGYVYASLMFIIAFIQSMLLHQYFHRCMIIGMRVRTALVAAVYKKSLLLNNAARKKSTVGEIVNLMSVDAQRFIELTSYLNMLWSAPLQMVVSLYFLWKILGPSILAGVAVMVLMIPINAFIAKKSRVFQVLQMKLKDSRIKLMSEILSGIKVLKMYAWERSFQQKIMDIRNEELNVLRKAAYLNAGTSFTWTCAPFLVSLTTFTVYVRSSPDNVLDAEKAFVSLSLFNILRFPLSMLPMLIANLVQTSVSVKRLQSFLKNEELDETNVLKHAVSSDGAITIENGVFSWDISEDRPTLQNINVCIKPGSFVGIVGHVGCGKSTLLSAVLGETDKLKGVVSINGSIAYVAQQAWIQNATLRDNILFGKAFNELTYERIIEACALRDDIKEFDGGDMIEIGEKGINLSGGQKLRVSLARALYSNADIYLMDDPLSAVDSHVGKHIFDKVFGKNGLLKNKTRVLVTHGINFLPEVDQIIVMSDGQISEVGTYSELLSRKGAFAEFLYNYLEKENPDEIAQIDDAEIQLREEILSQIGMISNENVQGSLEKLHRLRTSSMSSNRDTASINHNVVRRSVSKEPSDGHQSHRSLTRLTSSTSNVGKDSEKELLAQKAKMEDKKKLIQDETVEKGSVKLSVFVVYMKSLGYVIAVMIMLLYVLNNAASVYANFWLSAWSNDVYSNITDVRSQRDLRLGVYGALGLAQGLAVVAAALVLAQGSLRSSSKLHAEILESGFRAPMKFFDSTPAGRILNRFSKDVDVVDSQLPRSLHSWIACCLSVFSTLFVICYSTPMFLIIIVPMAVLYYLVQRFYVATSRQLRRLESVSRSPIYSHFGETVQGVSTIRAFGHQDRFILESERRVDENQLCYYPGIASNRWLAVRLEFVGNCLVMFAALFAVSGRDNLKAGIVGLSVSYALNITQTLNWLVRMTSELETNIVAVERIKEYAETEPEADWIVESNRPPDGWPTSGAVQLKEYSTKYRPELDPVIKDVSLSINGGEKVGIVGRTGSGKSSLTLGLFRIIESIHGSITIDGIDISKIGLHDLRSKLTIIPQDPVMFSGSLRMNLDPFSKYEDDEIWRALELAQLRTYVESLPDKLQFVCSERGENFSVGQRQLVCLVRAILRKTRILVLDEATSSVDLETDDLIQSTIRMEFAGSTVITIAHRLNTVLDYDRILVLDYGRIVEFDSPQSLLAKKSGHFYSLAREANLVSD